MGLLGILRRFGRSDVDEARGLGEATVDVGGGDHRTAQHFGPPGVDSRPRPGDFVALLERRRELAAVGYLDPAGGVAEAGEVRLYARDGDGVVVSVHLKSDGALRIDNRDGGQIEMTPGGDVSINGVVIDTSGNLAAPGDVTALDGSASVSLSQHRHPTSQGPTEAPTPTPSP